MKRNKYSISRNKYNSRSRKLRSNKQKEPIVYIKKSHLEQLRNTEQHLKEMNEDMLNKSNDEYMKLLESELEHKNRRIRNLEKQIVSEYPEEKKPETHSISEDRSPPIDESSNYGRKQNSRLSSKSLLYPSFESHSPQRSRYSRPPAISQPSDDSYFFRGFGKGGGGAPLCSPVSKDRVEKLREETLRQSPHDDATKNYKRFKFELQSYEEQTRQIEKELKRKKFAESLAQQIELKKKRKELDDYRSKVKYGSIDAATSSSFFETPSKSQKTVSPPNASRVERYENTPVGPNFGMGRRNKVSMNDMKDRYPALEATPSKSDLLGKTHPNFFPRESEKESVQRLKIQKEIEEFNVKKEQVYNSFISDVNKSKNHNIIGSNKQKRDISGMGRKISKKKNSRNTQHTATNRLYSSNKKKKGNVPIISRGSRKKVLNQRKGNSFHNKRAGSRGRKNAISSKNRGTGSRRRIQNKRREEEDREVEYLETPEVDPPGYVLDRKRSWKEDFLRLKDEIREERNHIREILNDVVKEVRMKRRTGMDNIEGNETEMFSTKKGKGKKGNMDLKSKSYFVPIHPNAGNLLSNIWNENENPKIKKKHHCMKKKDLFEY